MPKADTGSKHGNLFDPLSTPESPVNNMASEDAMVKTLMETMKPMLELIKAKIIASQQAVIIQLKESFHQQILQLNQTISE
jgi:hypothetical protein